MLADVFTGDAGIVIGTHALLENQVQFADLGLVVIDEQHRFGVEQRDALRAKAAGNRPHVLVMTATPIPRTVAMTVYGDLETSTLTELPAGRSPSPPTWCPRRTSRTSSSGPGSGSARRSSQGQQAYVVCPRVGDSSASSDDVDPDDFDPDDDDFGVVDMDGGVPARHGGRGASRCRSSTWPGPCSPARWPGCGSASCTAGCTRTRRTG